MLQTKFDPGKLILRIFQYENGKCHVLPLLFLSVSLAIAEAAVDISFSIVFLHIKSCWQFRSERRKINADENREIACKRDKKRAPVGVINLFLDLTTGSGNLISDGFLFKSY